MGRQLQLATTDADEVELLRFIRSLAPIRVFQSFARSTAELWIDDWETRKFPDALFCIWPQTFPWSPDTPRRCWSLVGAFFMSTATVAFTGRVTFLRRMDWTTMQRRLHGSLIQCGAGFVRSDTDHLVPRHIHRTFYQMLGHDMDRSPHTMQQRRRRSTTW